MKLSSACIGTLLAAVVSAATPKNQAPDTGIVTMGVTTEELDTFKLLSQYAGATYCYHSFNGEPHKMSCSQDKGNCPLVESANSTNVHPFLIKSTKTAGYIAVDDTNKLIVLSLQGTELKENPTSLATNLKLDQIETDLCGSDNMIDGCSVHGGYYDASQITKDEVEPILAQAQEENPDYQMVSTGHSLGGVLAAIVGTMLRNDGYTVDLVTFGQPHIGARDISNYIQKQAPAHGRNYRITHDNDIVPQLPKHDWGPWGHFYPEYFITTKEGIVTENDISRVDGEFLTFNGNEGRCGARGKRSSLSFLMGAKKGVAAHLDYFGDICGCESTAPKPAKGRGGRTKAASA